MTNDEVSTGAASFCFACWHWFSLMEPVATSCVIQSGLTLMAAERKKCLWAIA